jgi:hypothetical protein
VKPAVTMRKALRDPALLGNALVGPSWDNWRVILIAAAGEKLAPKERVVFRRFTGREHEPGQRIDEALFLIGRRGGKDRAASVLATYLAAFIDWSPVLAKGEKGLVLLVAPDQRQSKITRDYIEGVFAGSKLLSQLVVNRTVDTIELSNQISIDVRAASFRRLRGVTCVAVIATEAAYWQTDEASDNADIEILNAVRPSLVTTGGPLIIITTPHARKGEVWRLFDGHYGAKGDPLTLIVKGSTREFNPTLPAVVVERALERDPSAAGAEYLAEFRIDIESFVAREVVEAATVRGRRELPPAKDTHYIAFVDPSGGSIDSMTVAVAHREGDRAVLDALRERRPPFSPDEVVQDFAGLLRSYSIDRVQGDHHGGEWPREAFRKLGIAYEVSGKSKSQIYGETLALLNSGRVELLDNPQLVAQLSGLERRTARGGRDSIDHAPGAHDDICNAAFGALRLASTAPPALWARDNLLASHDMAFPKFADALMATVVADDRGMAAAFFCYRAAHDPPLIATDVCEMPLMPQSFHAVAESLWRMIDEIPTALIAIFAQTTLATEFQRLGYGAAIHDLGSILDDNLAISAATHIGMGRIKLSAAVIAKGQTLPLTILDGKTGGADALHLAMLAGAAVALSPGLQLGKRRAA